MVEPDCLEQESHNCQVEATGVWGRARGVAIYASFGTTSTTSSRIACCLGVQWLAT